MSTLTLSLLLGLLSSFFGALTNLLARQVMRFTSTRNYITLNFVLLTLMLLPFAPFFFQVRWSWQTFGLLALVALLDGAANYLYFLSFEISDAVTASSLLSLSPFFTLLLLPLAGPAQGALTARSVLGVVVIVAGIFTLNRAMQSAAPEGQRPAWQLKKLLAPTGASFFFGASVYLIKYLFSQGLTNPYSYYLLRAAMISLMMLVLIRPDLKWVSRPALGLVTGRLALVITQWMLLLYALDYGNPAVVKAVGDTSPLFVVAISAAFLKERVTRSKLLGVACILIGLVLLTL